METPPHPYRFTPFEFWNAWIFQTLARGQSRHSALPCPVPSPMSPPAPTLTTWTDWPGLPSPTLHMYVSSVSNVQMYVVIISSWCCKSRSGDIAHVAYVASVSDSCCKRLLKLFHLFSDVCCKRFDLDVAYVFTHMLQQYAPKYFIYFSLMLQKVFSCYLDVAYGVCWKYIFSMFHMLQFIWMLHTSSVPK
jgi:hypothetical protein